MQRFTVPQFIDIEDKIIGPVTTRQFLISMVTLFIITATYSAADFSLFIFLAAIEMALGGVLAFLKVNGRPFHFFILNVLQTLKRPSVRVWGKERNQSAADLSINRAIPTVKSSTPIEHNPPEPETLKHLALILDTGGRYSGEEV